MLTFKEYYKQQFKDIPKVWKLARKHKKYFAFFVTLITLFSPLAIHTMYLYDTGLIKADKRFLPEVKKR